jgi:hypothetical protein
MSLEVGATIRCLHRLLVMCAADGMLLLVLVGNICAYH